MSSSQPFQNSSPIAGRRKKSRFMYKHLTQLAGFSTTCALRVIAHVDLDAFYAQCEMVRLGVAEDQPLAVQQWNGLIAVNYPSRKYGLTRMISPIEAKKLCPNIILQHVATWKEGDSQAQYHEDAAKNIATHKVSLDPYRLESRRILACIKESLPTNLQRVEKAGIDEVFLDLSAQIHSVLLERYPELAGPPPYDDPTSHLPLPPTAVLDWRADALVDLDLEETEDDDPDWDDIAILIGSEIVRSVRAAIREKLKYTCSGGIAQNKVLAKLGSAHKKPNQQSVVRNRAVQQFLSDLKFTKMRGLGGKLGEQISSIYNTNTVKELLPITLDQLKNKLGDDTGTWVYQVIRGIDSSEVSSRTQIKSMLSAKSFRPSINTVEQANRWLRIFVADIYSRLVEEGVLENKRRPKTMNLQYRHGGQTKSRQALISLGKKVDERLLFDLAKTLMGQMIMEGGVWPCSNISLSVGGFEDGVVGNMGIGSFLVKGDVAKALNANPRDSSMATAAQDRPDKRRRIDSAPGIQKFFVKTECLEEHDDDFGAQTFTGMDHHSAAAEDADSREDLRAASNALFHDNEAIKEEKVLDISTDLKALHQERITNYMCDRCNLRLESENSLQNHHDWHFAKDLEDEDRGASGPSRSSAMTGSKKVSQTSNKKKAGRGKPEKGQMKLAFG